MVRLVLFQLVWLACAIGAARGVAWPGVAAGLAALVAIGACAPDGRCVATLAVLCGALGLVAESALAATAVLVHAAPWPIPGLAPAWIVALWAAFAITLAPTLRVLGAAAIAKSALLGALLGPLSYLAGERLGALALAAPIGSGLVVLAATWGLAMPLMMWAARTCEAQRAPGSDGR